MSKSIIQFVIKFKTVFSYLYLYQQVVFIYFSFWAYNILVAVMSICFSCSYCVYSLTTASSLASCLLIPRLRPQPSLNWITWDIGVLSEVWHSALITLQSCLRVPRQSKYGTGTSERVTKMNGRNEGDCRIFIYTKFIQRSVHK